MQPFNALQVANHFEEIARLRISLGAQHAHQALGRPPRAAAQFRKTDCRVDVITQNRLACIEVAGQEALDTFPQVARSRPLLCRVQDANDVDGVPAHRV